MKVTVKCGDQPGPGRYVCKKCGKSIRLESADEKIYPCPVCQYCEYKQG